MSTVHAQTATLTPAEKATLSQSLAGLKAKLLDLQAQAAAQAAVSASAPTQTVTAAPLTAVSAAPAAGTSAAVVVPAPALDNATMMNDLAALTAALSKLNQTIAANPASLTASNLVALQSVLSGMTASLVAMNESLATGGAVSPVAMAAPIVTVVPSDQSASAAASAQVAPTAANQQPTVAAGASPAVQTAQVANQVSLSRGWMVTFAILVLLLIVFAIWRSGKKEERVSGKPAKQANASGSSAPKGAQIVSSMQKQAEVKVANQNQHDVTRSPMSSVVSTPPPAPASGNAVRS